MPYPCCLQIHPWISTPPLSHWNLYLIFHKSNMGWQKALLGHRDQTCNIDDDDDDDDNGQDCWEKFETWTDWLGGFFSASKSGFSGVPKAAFTPDGVFFFPLSHPCFSCSLLNFMCRKLHKNNEHIHCPMPILTQPILADSSCNCSRGYIWTKQEDIERNEEKGMDRGFFFRVKAHQTHKKETHDISEWRLEAERWPWIAKPSSPFQVMLLPNSCYKISLSHLPPTKHTHTQTLSLSLSKIPSNIERSLHWDSSLYNLQILKNKFTAYSKYWVLSNWLNFNCRDEISGSKFLATQANLDIDPEQ